jgi:cytochrome c-type biogenesis protein CcmE
VVLVRGLGANLVYYATPTEVLADHQSGAEHRLRLGGQVLPGTVARSGHRVSFVVGDGTSQVTVVGADKLPSMFRPGEGVVVEGYLAGGAGHRTFRADTVLVKHGSDYQPPTTAPSAPAAAAPQAAR